MKKYTFLFIFSILIIIFQQAIFSRFSLFDAGVNLVFVFIVCFSLLRDELECVVIALFCGIITDAFFPFVFGINTVVYLISAYLLAQIEKKVYKDSLIIPVMLTFGMSMLKNILFYVYLYIASIRFNFSDLIVNKLIYEPLFNSILCILVYKLIKRLLSLKIVHNEWKF